MTSSNTSLVHVLLHFLILVNIIYSIWLGASFQKMAHHILLHGSSCRTNFEKYLKLCRVENIVRKEEIDCYKQIFLFLLFVLVAKLKPNQHYFFDCRYYREFKDRLFQSVSEISTVSLHTLLFGDKTLSLADNEKIFSAVHSYIVDTDHFRSWITFWFSIPAFKITRNVEIQSFLFKNFVLPEY